MTTEIEKTFFDTFGIEPKYKTCVFKYCKNKKEYDCENCNDREWHYPQISDNILLELIVIIMFHEDLYGFPRNVKDLKENVLKQLIQLYQSFSVAISYDGEYQQTAEQIKHQVCTLFEEG